MVSVKECWWRGWVELVVVREHFEFLLGGRQVLQQSLTMLSICWVQGWQPRRRQETVPMGDMEVKRMKNEPWISGKDEPRGQGKFQNLRLSHHSQSGAWSEFLHVLMVKHFSKPHSQRISHEQHDQDWTIGCLAYLFSLPVQLIIMQSWKEELPFPLRALPDF